MNFNFNSSILCKIYRCKMMSLFLVTMFSFSVLCDETALLEVPELQSIEPGQISNSTDNLEGLMKVIMEALDSAKLTGDRLTPNEEQVESLVMELSPEKRKVLNEILGLVVNQPEENIYHKPENLKKPQVAKQIEVFSLPPGRTINVHDLLKFLLEPSPTTPSDLEHLKRIIYDNQMTDLSQDPVLQKTLNKFMFDTNLESHEIDHLD